MISLLRRPQCFGRCFLALVLCVSAWLAPHNAWAAKNVIIMIADGSGNNTWLATSMYQGKVGRQVYDQAGWRRLCCSTYPLNLSHKPTGNQIQDQLLVYDPVKAWDTNRKNASAKDLALKNATLKEAASKDAKPAGATSRDFASYLYLTTTPTDSAASATALASGRKTYNNAINWSNDDRPLQGQTIAEIAKAQGKAVGAITTVEWSDATPAGLGGAHNRNRSNHAEIANEMLTAGTLDVIMGAGNPDFDNDGRPLRAEKHRDYQWVGGPDTWKTLKSGQGDWKLLESKAQFEALLSGPTPPKVVGTLQAGGTTQEKRGHGRVTLSPVGTPPQQPQPFAVPLNRNVPSLAVMTKGAIHCLENNPQGFYLMIEGGAVDWANHANEPERMVEEQIDYIKAVEAVVAWVDAHSNWNDTLLILTADHETGLLWGPDSAKVAFQPLKDRGPGKLPGMKHNSHGHSNSLVPLYVRGPGSERFAALRKGQDPRAAAQWHYSGRYVDNTDVFAVMRAEVVKAKGE
jgi:alkaline phosphatase